ncbi:hypothetical protein HID58_032403 [Brassica napus]|uniref:Uncharacterized protein n=1 Tax=Brassica napus TaxID=3708 RepID=A0ABQ8BX65_BRANA|nr:hypothetical protein HID58_032403 [Brassica napus]
MMIEYPKYILERNWVYGKETVQFVVNLNFHRPKIHSSPSIFYLLPPHSQISDKEKKTLSNQNGGSSIMDDAADEQSEVRRRRHHHTNSHRHPQKTSTLLCLLQWKTLLPLLPHGISLRSHGSVATWFGPNIGVLLLNKYLLFYYGFRYPIFLTMTHTLSCAPTAPP